MMLPVVHLYLEAQSCCRRFAGAMSGLWAEWSFLAIVVAIVAVDANAQDIQTPKSPDDLIGSWIVKVEGAGKNRSMVVTNVSKKSDGVFVLEAKFGWVGSENPVVSAEVQQGDKGIVLSLTANSGAKVFAEQAQDGAFVGTFVNTGGNSLPTMISKVEKSSSNLSSQVTNISSAPKAQASLSPTCISSGKGCAETPDLKIGDRWMYRVVDMYNNEEVMKYEHKITGIHDNEVRVETTTLSSKSGTNVGRPVKRSADRLTWTFPDSRIRAGKQVALAFPLEVGKKWDYEYQRDRSDSGVTFFNVKAEVVGQEEVQVAAGKFNTLKVVHYSAYSTRTSGQTGADRTIETIWYAPDVKRPIKREYDGGRGGNKELTELVQYEVK